MSFAGKWMVKWGKEMENDQKQIRGTRQRKLYRIMIANVPKKHGYINKDVASVGTTFGSLHYLSKD